MALGGDSKGADLLGRVLRSFMPASEILHPEGFHVGDELSLWERMVESPGPEHTRTEIGYSRNSDGGRTSSTGASYLPTNKGGSKFMTCLEPASHSHRGRGIAALNQVLVQTWDGDISSTVPTPTL